MFASKLIHIYIYIYIYTVKCPIPTTSTYRPLPYIDRLFYNTNIKSTIYSLYFGKFCKSTTSLNGPREFTHAGGRFTEVLLYIELGVFIDPCVWLTVGANILKLYHNWLLSGVYSLWSRNAHSRARAYTHTHTHTHMYTHTYTHT